MEGAVQQLAMMRNRGEGIVAHLRRGAAPCLLSAALLAGCSLPAVRLPFPVPVPAAQKLTCPAIPVGVVIAADDVPDARDQQEGYELASQEINQAGGIQGCPLRVVYDRSEGEGTNPDAVQSAMLGLADGGAVAVVGATDAAATKRIAAIAQYVKMPVVITPDTPDDLMANGSAWIFRINPASKTYAAAAFDLVKEKIGGAAKVAILYDQTEYGQSVAGTAGQAALDRGLALASYLSYDPAAEDFTALLLQVRNANPDALFVISSDANQARAILAGIADQGLKIALVIGNGGGFTSHALLYAQDGQLNAGVTGLALTVPWSPDLKGRAVPDFDQRLAAYRRSAHSSAAYPAVLATVQAYTALHLVADAMIATAKASPRDWKTLLADPDQLAAYRGELAQTLRGFKAAEHNSMLGPVEFDANGQNGAVGVIVQAVSGSLVAVYPQAAATHPLVLSGR
jgi:branched-chain amino acid transport system substrate-binding protein